MPNKRISADTRFQPIVDFYFAEFERRHGSKPVWDGSDGMALGRLLFTQKQLSVEKLTTLVADAFAWSDAWWGPIRKGDFCPLQPGFRFREFCAHFGRVACFKSQRPPAPRVSAREVHAVLRQYREQAMGHHEPEEFWDGVLTRTLGITHRQAAAILYNEPMRPDRAGD